MCQLLFVEDEPVLLKSMLANDWAAIGIADVFAASSGLEALAILDSTAIDIVVTDIRMPGMNGLQLCEHIREHYPGIKCILLSGYGEFEYAQKAIQSGVVNYLLKPIKDEELMDEISRAKQLIEQEREHHKHGMQMVQAIRSHLPLLQSSLLGDLLSGMRLPHRVLQERMQEYGLSFELERDYPLFMIRLDQSGSALGGGDASLYEFAVHNIVNEVLEPSYELWFTRDTYGYMCYLLKARSDELSGELSGATSEERLKEVARELTIKVQAYLKGTISIMIGPIASFPAELVNQYRKCLNAFRKISHSDHAIITSLSDAYSQFRPLESLYAPPSFQQLLEAERWSDARKKLATMFAEMKDRKQDTEENMMEIVYALMNAFLFKAHLLGKSLMEMTGFEADIVTEPGLFSRLDQVTQWAELTLQSMETSSVRDSKDNKNQLILKIHRFIESHIAKDVSLQAIADHVSLHPAYLSSLYKHETKENISDYIMRYRMEKASSLLRTTDIKIYELSAQLGFQNPPYFSKLFKYYFGVTPQEYRNRNQAES